MCIARIKRPVSRLHTASLHVHPPGCCTDPLVSHARSRWPLDGPATRCPHLTRHEMPVVREFARRRLFPPCPSNENGEEGGAKYGAPRLLVPFLKIAAGPPKGKRGTKVREVCQRSFPDVLRWYSTSYGRDCGLVSSSCARVSGHFFFGRRPCIHPAYAQRHPGHFRASGHSSGLVLVSPQLKVVPLHCPSFIYSPWAPFSRTTTAAPLGILGSR